MIETAGDRGRGNCPVHGLPSQIRDPIDFLHRFHLAEREVCAILDRLAGQAAVDDREVERAAAFLARELPSHILDEEEDLFPLMRLRCEAEDEIERILGRLHCDHRHADFDTPGIVTLLTGSRADPSVNDRDRMRRYANHARRHLILENAIVLPFARLRLSKADLLALSLRMAKRRDHEPFPEHMDAG